MDIKTIINFALWFVFVIGGLLIGRMFKKADKIQTDITTVREDTKEKFDYIQKQIYNINVDLPTNYVTKSDLSHVVNSLYSRFDSFDDKIEKRFDRMMEALENKQNK